MNYHSLTLQPVIDGAPIQISALDTQNRATTAGEYPQDKATAGRRK